MTDNRNESPMIDVVCRFTVGADSIQMIERLTAVGLVRSDRLVELNSIQIFYARAEVDGSAGLSEAVTDFTARLESLFAAEASRDVLANCTFRDLRIAISPNDSINADLHVPPALIDLAARFSMDLYFYAQ